MGIKTSLLTGAAATAVAVGVIFAAPAIADPIPPATSYADLLAPVPNAMERLSADDARYDNARHLNVGVTEAQWGNGPYAHHHHHHHHSRRWYLNNGYYWGAGGWVLRPVYHHHHHHHHHHHNNY